MKPNCCIVNLSSQPAAWIPQRILGQDSRQEDSGSTQCYRWKISTKYFHADVLLQLVSCRTLLEDSERLQPVIQSTEAVVFYCDTTRESFQLAASAWERFKEVSPAVCLCVVERTVDVAAGKFLSLGFSTPSPQEQINQLVSFDGKQSRNLRRQNCWSRPCRDLPGRGPGLVPGQAVRTG